MGNYVGSIYSNVESKCPRCGKLFKKWVFYSGRLPAKYFCEACAKFAGDPSNSEEITVRANRRFD